MASKGSSGAGAGTSSSSGGSSGGSSSGVGGGGGGVDGGGGGGNGNGNAGEIAVVLPAGWKVAVDARGRTYYYHGKTKQVSWTVPVDESAVSQQNEQQATVQHATETADQAAAVEDATASEYAQYLNYWEAVVDASGRTYYFNLVTRETSWVLPENGILADVASLTAAAAAATTAAATTSAEASEASTSAAAETQVAEDWVKLYDDKKGRYYYYEKASRRTTWTQPAGFVDTAAQAAASDDWASMQDEHSGHTYYYHRRSRRTTWTAPAGTNMLALSATEGLPAGWERHFHAESGREYYCHVASGHVTWVLPTGNEDAATYAAGVETSSETSGAAAVSSVPKFELAKLPAAPPHSGSVAVHKSVMAGNDLPRFYCSPTSAVLMQYRTPQPAVHTGFLSKQGSGMSFVGRRSWKRRFFVLKDDTLSYYQDATSVTPNGQVDIYGAIMECTSKTGATIHVRFGDRSLAVEAASAAELDGWKAALQKAGVVLLERA